MGSIKSGISPWCGALSFNNVHQLDFINTNFIRYILPIR
ncbi:MAG: hypothetical protein UZ08_BCD001000399 [Candidatus Parvibacillus calidus]|nr:MAG: hypothetical protein UZ08_BCD001000399 [Candidatus Parvibacillus calidus]